MSVSVGTGVSLDNLVTAQTNPLTGGIEKCESAGVNLNTIYSDQITDGYHCHLWSGSSGNGDGVVPDISGSGRHGTFNTNMTKALAWTTPGFASTDTGGAYRTFLIPVLNFDYAAGESLIVVWKGRGTAPTAYKGLLGDSNGSSESGIAVRVDSAGKIQSYISDGTGRFMDFTANTVVEPTVTHTYALAIDGVARKYEQHEDAVVTRSLIAVGDGQTAYDCRSTKPLKLGTQSDFSAAADTIALQTQALVILRGRKGRGLPTNYRQLMQNIARNPDRLVTKAWW